MTVPGDPQFGEQPWFVNVCAYCRTAKGSCSYCGGMGYCIYRVVYNDQGTAIGARVVAQPNDWEIVRAGFNYDSSRDRRSTTYAHIPYVPDWKHR